MKFKELIGVLFWNYEQKRLRSFWRIAFYSSLLLSILLIISLLLTFINYSPNTFVFSFVILFSVMVTTFVAGKWIDKRRFKDFGFIPSNDWWKEFTFGFVLGTSLIGMIFLIAWVTGNVSVNGYFRGWGQTGPHLLEFIVTLLLFICVGIYEEMIIRGYILINLAEGLKIHIFRRQWSSIFALLISSLLFGLSHISNPNASWISALAISLAGILLGLGMVLTGQLGLSIGLHIAWNFFLGLVFGFPVSGIKFDVTIISTELTGPKWFTGGDFGPEAGFLGLFATLIGCLLIILWMRSRGMLSIDEELADYNPASK